MKKFYIIEFIIVLSFSFMISMTFFNTYTIINQNTKIIQNQELMMEGHSLQLEGILLILQTQIKESIPNDILIPNLDSNIYDDNEMLSYNWMTPDHIQLLDAIAKVESNKNSNAVGDNGNALGMYQIWESYWIDAVQHTPSIGGSYENVTYPEYATKIVLSYWDRYGKNNQYDIEALARMHNGGPQGHRKQSTEPYWEKIKYELDR